ncbi:FIST signal transduction protein [Polynucleobacter sp. MWH-Braz-FAM2G]|uniref:FIST signal transduction protein n=1 Tax=Polynucleobacter sp. MWH-Braz-FAM2G TaxID=1855883 RepID=UPI001BFCF1DE|nr:FIST N-terminal domain-containing protein [Polynucleobacter sp. MWH-Braz-FAM2G]QWD89997.1 FIST C-terminal domain-containing protein [Polynucleobacter sp. MWH-Braz-FAM2G]
MHIDTYRWTESEGWDIRLSPNPDINLVLVCAEHPYFKEARCYEEIRAFFPAAEIVGCSSSGNICGDLISDQDIVLSAISFSTTKISVKSTLIENDDEVERIVSDLVREFSESKPKHVFALSDGLSISGSDFTKTLNTLGVPVTGGLAGDSDRFNTSWVMVNGPAKRHQIALIGFYGDLKIAYGFSTGWREFGPERRVTRSVRNIVYEIDHRPALEVYTKYLGELAKELPGSGLRFPLSVTDSSSGRSYVRTLLGVNWEEMSLNFAGDVPQGSLCKLMKTEIDSLIDASVNLTNDLHLDASKQDSLCLVVSCVGRRLVMDQIAGEEIEAIQSILGPRTTVFGFYSYGEVAPFDPAVCALHNQTTTLTLFSE